MPVALEDTPAIDPPRVAVRASLAVELTWALGAAGNPEHLQQHPALGHLYETSPALRHRVATFWEGTGPGLGTCFEEIAVLAHHGGLLFSTDSQVLLSQLDELCASAPDGLRLASEPDADRAALLARLRALRSSAEARRRYVSLVSEVWAGVEGSWQRYGRLAVNNEVSARASALAGGAAWYEVAGPNRWGHTLVNLVNDLPPDGELAIVPAFFNRRGIFLDLPGLVLLGVPADATGPAPVSVPRCWRGGLRPFPTPPGWPCSMPCRSARSMSPSWPARSRWHSPL